jgi:hypothetical protein
MQKMRNIEKEGKVQKKRKNDYIFKFFSISLRNITTSCNLKDF